MLLQRIKQGFNKIKNKLSVKFYIVLAAILCFSMIALPILTIADSVGVNTKTERLNKDEYEEYAKLYNGTLHTISLITPMYSKLKNTEIFDNDSRDNIYNLINSKPGITMGSITRELKLKNGTASHHLRILEREGLIKSKKTGKFRRYYVMGTKVSGFNEVQDKIIQKVEENPGITQSELGRELKLSRQLVNYHVKDLVDHNAIKSEKQGNKCCCFTNGIDELQVNDYNYY